MVCVSVDRDTGAEQCHLANTLTFASVVVILVMRRFIERYVRWLVSRVVSVLDSGVEGLGSNRSRDADG